MNLLKSLWQDLKAGRRGERRVVPRGVRGRIYARKDGSGGNPGLMRASSRPKATIKRRVYRAATGRWEDVD